MGAWVIICHLLPHLDPGKPDVDEELIGGKVISMHHSRARDGIPYSFNLLGRERHAL